MVGALKRGLKGLLALALLCPAEAFYIPGWSPKSHKNGEQIPLLVNKVYSDNTQLTYAYYDLPFVCPPTGKHNIHTGLLSGQSVPLNLGEVLRGDRIMTSDIGLQMGQDNTCQALCTQELSRKDLKRTKEMITDGYVAEWIVDNLPGATSFVTVDKTRKYYAAGFKLGYTEISANTGKPQYYINNHHTIVLRYRRAPGRAGDRDEKIIVGFEVYPKSIGDSNKRDATGCPEDLQNIGQGFELYLPPNKTSDDYVTEYPDPSIWPIDVEEDEEDGSRLSIPFSYSVYFREDESIEWAHRWDLYFVNQEEGSHIHWLAIINSLIICCLLTGVTMIILAKTVRSDIRTYKESVMEGGKIRVKKSKEKSSGLLEAPDNVDDEADVSEDDDEALEDVTGWKLLHGDVFRNPRGGVLLAPLVGSGMQLLFMAIGLVILSALGVLNPSFRGGFVSVGVGLFVFAGVFSGYFSARVFKAFDGKDHHKNAFVTAVLFPGLAFGLVFVLNVFVWTQASSTAIPFTSLLTIVVLWLCIQVPLVYVGSYWGYNKAPVWEHPTKTAPMPREIPGQPWYIRTIPSVLLSGLIPFAVIFIELLFVFQSLWKDKSGYYYVYGFLAAVSVILLVTVAEVTVVTVYMQLCSEDHRWWWRSFFVGGGSAVWVFAYSVWYYIFKLQITGFASGVLFFVYSIMACFVYGLLTGTVGFLCAYAFVRRIYSAIKAD
ncbi:hypothetical protein N3K66_003388 [Trichothecium roseum]|uniref:Uncharacterized protein n=1 Tax=Trichothecium roseum TaxID=47278 RepID=A0ACC0V598_9HYPO|nr:hypothetical protein N3K66_003388 [Trichothecium roseum]